MNRILLISFFFLLFSCFKGISQDLDSLLEAELDKQKKTEYVAAAFKSTHIVLGQSIENKAKGELNFLISHHFGNVTQGAYNFFGLDYSEIRIGFEYGITDWFQVGIGRSSFNKVFDGNFKLKMLRQSSGDKNFPFSLSLYSNLALTSLRWEFPERDNRFDSRLSYAFEVLFARKFSSALSLQIAPVLIHRNMVESTEDQNDVFSIALGGRIKLSKRFSLNAEYNYVLPGKTADDFYDSFNLGFDLETGGHVFQIFLTNSNGMIEQAFVPQTIGSWLDGDVKLGFNITRTFTIIKDKQIGNENAY